MFHNAVKHHRLGQIGNIPTALTHKFGILGALYTMSFPTASAQAKLVFVHALFTVFAVHSVLLKFALQQTLLQHLIYCQKIGIV